MFFLFLVLTIMVAMMSERIDPKKQVVHPIVVTNSIPEGRIRASIASRMRAVVVAYWSLSGELSIEAMAAVTYSYTKPGST